jgi:glycosyltransferase involved in cell wall biosynthesis
MSSARVHLSGVVACQDNARTIEHVVDCLLTWCDEVVLLDGGSTDGTLELGIARDPARVRGEVSPFSGNIAVQKNKGFDLARGKWLFCMDSDELMWPKDGKRLRRLTFLPGAKWFSIPRYWLVEQDGEVHYLSGPTYYRDRQLRLFRNVPGFRYDERVTPIHHGFVNKHGFGRPLRAPHLFHYTFLLQDRARRQQKFDDYMREEGHHEDIHRMYLWEDNPEPTAKVPEPLPGLFVDPNVCPALADQSTILVPPARPASATGTAGPVVAHAPHQAVGR